MNSLASFLRFEYLLQMRTLRFRLCATAYLVASMMPAVSLFILAQQQPVDHLGASSFFIPVLTSQRFLTVILVLAVVGNRSGEAAIEQSLSALSSSSLSNANYLLNRWLSMVLLILPLTVLPTLVALILARTVSAPLTDPWFLPVAWAFLILPVVLIVSAAWLGLVTIAKGDIGALILYFLLSSGLGLISQQLLRLFDWRVELESLWMGMAALQTELYYGTFWLRQEDGFNLYQHAVSAAAFDFDLARQQWGHQLALPASLASLILVAAMFFLGRTRRDLRPVLMRPDHPLRTLWPAWVKARYRYAADAALTRERWWVCVGVLLVAWAVGYLLSQQARYLDLAHERYRVEMQAEELQPMDPAVVPVDWRLQGRLKRNGFMAVKVTGKFHHTGDTPSTHLAMSLNPHLEVKGVTADRRLMQRRSWDRMILELDPALEPGQEMSVVFELEGRPQDLEWALVGWWNFDSFATKFKGWLEDPTMRVRSNLGATVQIPAISNHRIELQPGDLIPIPRYETWQLTPPPTAEGERGLEVPTEEVHPVVDLTVDLESPADWFIGDSCGHGSELQGGKQILRGECRSPLGTYRLLGGPLRVVEGGGPVKLAVYPHQVEWMESHLESLQHLVATSSQAWPGELGIDRLVAVAWPSQFRLDVLRGRHRRWYVPTSRVMGQMISVSEFRLLDPRPLDQNTLVGDMLANRLLRRRSLAPKQQHLFRAILVSLMVRRMNADDDPSGATMTGPPWFEATLKIPLLKSKSSNRNMLAQRVPAVFAAIEHRVGRQRLYEGIESFLAQDTAEPGTIRQLIAELERHGGVSLERMYDDFFVHGRIPKLRLLNASARRIEAGWRVQAELRNAGGGEVHCPVVVRTEGHERQIMVVVGSKETVDIALEVDQRPHTLLLDPERTCHRLISKGSDKVERISLLG